MKRLIVATFVCALVVLIGIEDFASSKVSASKISSTQPQDQFVAGRVLVKFQTQVLPEHARQIIAALGARDAAQISELGVHILELPAQANEVAFIQAFQGRPEIQFAELDHILPPAQQIVPNDPFYTDPNAWALQKINGPEAWFTSTGSPSIIVAILDTGVDGTHPDLAANMVPGWNIYNNNADTSDVRGHGTMVAGTAAASSNNSIGVASVAWGCKIMPVRISDSNGYATVSDIANGLTWAANHGARVANISFNANGYSTVSSAANYFQSKGGVVSVAAGNDGLSVQTADDRYMLTVGATDSLDSLFSWSNRGNNLDVVAPGHVATTGRGGGLTFVFGRAKSAFLVMGESPFEEGLRPSYQGPVRERSGNRRNESHRVGRRDFFQIGEEQAQLTPMRLAEGRGP